MAKRKSDDIYKMLKGFSKGGAREKSEENIPTGHFVLDFVIQYGTDPTKVDLSHVEGYDPSKTIGIPLGKLVEIFGEEGGGKSSLAYRIIGYAQKMGHKVAWFDVEHSFQENLATLNGCDIDADTMFYSNCLNKEDPDKGYYAEDIINDMIQLMKNGIKVIVVDSIANLIPKTLFEADAEQEFMGLLARFLSRNLSKLVAHAEENNTLLIFINQLREKIGVRYGNPETSPGGHSLHHNASLRLKISKKGGGDDANIYISHPETGDRMLIGRHSRIKLVKNRFAKPFDDPLLVPMYYEKYFPEIEDIAFDTGRQIRLISVRNGVYNWRGLKIEGRKGFIDHVKENSLIDDLIKDIRKVASEKGVIPPPEISLYEFTDSGVTDEKLDDGKVSRDGKKKDSPSSEDNSKKTRRKKSS